MPKAVIFDVDGTLIDSNDLHAAAWVDGSGIFDSMCALKTSAKEWAWAATSC
jgi:beta-phosphoglucomutase-like phosphatase (HAD superfamily)